MSGTLPGEPGSIVHRTRGRRQGPITRLMSPSDLGQVLKPFVFLDLFAIDAPMGGGMGLHPHSGIATVTVVAEGAVRFDDAESGAGVIGYGGVEWMRSGHGVWHGEELSITQPIRGFQLWIALPPELECGPVDSQYLEAAAMPKSGPATIIVGSYDGLMSPVRAHEGINYLIVTLQPGERWTYAPPAHHDIAWAAAASGAVAASAPIEAGELVVFAPGRGSLTFEGAAHDASVFVIGSAIPHPHDLVVGNHSVHTSARALAAGETHIAALRAGMDGNPGRRPAAGSVPIVR